MGTLRDGSSRDLIQAVTNAVYTDPGYLLFVRGGALLAQPFDTKQLAFAGEPRVVADDLIENDANHHFEFSAGPNGRLIYRSGSSDSQLTWVDRAGKPLGTIGASRRIGITVRLSPDQQHVIVEQNDADGRPEDLWMFDTARNVVTRMTLDPAGDFAPAWSPDGAKIAFSSMRLGMGSLHVADTANPSLVTRLTSSKQEQVMPDDWTRDGAAIVAERSLGVAYDLWLYPAAGGEGKPYLATPFVEKLAALSPDNSFIAYASNESGRDEVYVEHFPSHAGRRQLSSAGGVLPRWRGDGRELFYVALGGDVVSVDMTSETSTPKLLFHLPGVSYDVTRDGQRFIVDRPVDENFHTPLTFLSNWMSARQ